MLLLWALILRAASVELRGKMRRPWARRAWDWGFFAGSGGATLLFGVAVGNALRGIPLDARGTFTGGLPDLLGPYCLMTGAMAFAMFAMHGAIYLSLKDRRRPVPPPPRRDVGPPGGCSWSCSSPARSGRSSASPGPRCTFGPTGGCTPPPWPTCWRWQTWAGTSGGAASGPPSPAAVRP